MEVTKDITTLNKSVAKNGKLGEYKKDWKGVIHTRILRK
jgi:hypothetical protein